MNQDTDFNIVVKNDPYITRWQREYPHLLGDWIRFLPVGWYDLIDHLFGSIEAIEPRDPAEFAGSVSLSIRWYPGSAEASVTPHSMMDKWSPEQCQALIRALRQFAMDTEKTCQVCGKPAVGILKYQDHRHQEVLCQTHMDERRAAE